MADYTVIEVNAWVLRCMFNQSRIVERISAGEFTTTLRRKTLSKRLNHPNGTRSEMLWIRDQGGIEIGTVHHYIFPNGPATPLDPKTLTVGTTRYVIHPDQKIANPEHLLPFVWMQRMYGWIRRKIICPVFGPLDVVPRINIGDLFPVTATPAYQLY
jgi:hypothetical protein